MRLPRCILLVGLAACSAETLALEEGDGGSSADISARDQGLPDVGARPDAELSDLGPPDTGSRQCEPPARFDLTVRGFGAGRSESVLRLEPGPPPRLSNDSGQQQIVFGEGVPTPPIADALYWVEVESEQPFWVEYRIRLREIAPEGGPGALVWVGWSGSGYSTLEETGLRARYLDEGCVLSADDCGTQDGLQLEVSFDGEQFSAGSGQSVEAPGLRVVNGRSARYVDGPFCTDIPSIWYEGAVVLQRGLSCAALQRDVCIAEPGCVLYGSESFDPRYICLPAEGDCERRPTEESCRAAGARCAWDVGTCYCPEDAVCACGGGPAPKCRSTCGTFAGFTCPNGRYCEDATVTPPMCVQPPDGGGRCEWAPADCGGVPNVEVCACTMGGRQRFSNDCLRRQSRAGPANADACP